MRFRVFEVPGFGKVVFEVRGFGYMVLEVRVRVFLLSVQGFRVTGFRVGYFGFWLLVL